MVEDKYIDLGHNFDTPWIIVIHTSVKRTAETDPHNYCCRYCLIRIAFPLPSLNVNQSLFAGLDDDKIEQLAHWYDEANTIPGRAWHLQFVRKNGTVVDITPASHYEKSTDKAGSITITCSAAEDRVIVRHSEMKPICYCDSTLTLWLYYERS